MSHRAIVAIQTGADTYDIHYSANGAHDLQLTELLEDHLAGRTMDLDAVAEAETAQIPQLEKWGALDDIEGDDTVVARNADEPAINREPRATDVPSEYIGATFDYDNIEAFYAVRNGEVETYVPVWLEPNVVRPWRDHLRVEVYPGGNLGSDPRAMMDRIESNDPTRVIDAETMSGVSWTDDTIIWDVVRNHHQAVYALQRQMVSERSENEMMDGDEDFDAQGVLTLGGRVLTISGPTDEEITPDPQARGILIRIPNTNTAAYTNVRDVANDARIKAGVRLNNQATPPTEDELQGELKQVLVTLLKEYPDRVASSSPPPFGPLAEKVSKALGTS